MPRAEPRLKVVVVGDGACGKTSLLHVFSGQPFDPRYIPTVFKNFVAPVEYAGRKYDLTLWDTAGQEEFNRLRPLSYDRANVVIICYAMDNPDSLANVKTNWMQELHALCPGVPYILVGCKSDLRRDPEAIQQLQAEGKNMVTAEVGKDMANEIEAAKFFECSAKENVGIQEIFRAVVEVSKPVKKSKTCTVM